MLSVDDRVSQLLEILSLDEKLRLIGQYQACTTYAIPEKGIPSLSLADGATGVNGTHVILDYMSQPENDYAYLQQRFYQSNEFEQLLTADLETVESSDKDILGLVKRMKKARPNNKQFICFPSGILAGASFSCENAYGLGSAVANEFRDSGFDICYGPNVDIARDPLGGRNYEMYGEDPYLVEQTAVSFIKGMQDMGVGACAKHFVANNQETHRNHSNAYMSQRTLHELYARGFEAAVREADVKAIMTAYSAVNGRFSSFNSELMNDVVREKWGFKGIFVNDWGAVEGKESEALQAGIDLLLCGPMDMSAVKRAVEEAPAFESVIDNRVRSLLTVIFELKNDQAAKTVNYVAEDLLAQALENICQGSVLLKNQDAVLPLKNKSKVTFYGKRSKELIAFGSGSTKVTTTLHSNPFEESQKYASQVTFENMDGCDTVIYTVGAPAGENVDREEMDIEPQDRSRLRVILKEAKSKGLKTVVILNVSGPVTMTDWLEDADSILCVFIPGSMGGTAIAQMLFGEKTPMGKLPITFPVRYEDTPSFPNFPSVGDTVYYGEGIFVGYRSYDKKKLPVQFPFGYGLSYTQFDFELLDVPSVVDIRETPTFSVTVKVKNTEAAAGAEVVQVYVGQVAPRIIRPERELVGFRKVLLEPGQEEIRRQLILLSIHYVISMKNKISLLFRLVTMCCHWEPPAEICLPKLT